MIWSILGDGDARFCAVEPSYQQKDFLNPNGPSFVVPQHGYIHRLSQIHNPSLTTDRHKIARSKKDLAVWPHKHKSLITRRAIALGCFDSHTSKILIDFSGHNREGMESR
jgi:hypothetical protein